MRQHPAFQELLNTVGVPPVNEFKPSGDPIGQYADFIYRSGRKVQHESWRQLLIGQTSQQEKP